MQRLYAVIAGFLKSRNVSTKPRELIYHPLKGGSQAALYHFDFNEKTYVVRVLPQNADAPTRKQQITLAKMAGEIQQKTCRFGTSAWPCSKQASPS